MSDSVWPHRLRPTRLLSLGFSRQAYWSGLPLLSLKTTTSARSQHGRCHPWQGHAERPDGQGESGLRGSPWVSLSIYPTKNQNLPALLYCAFPLFWLSLEKVNSRLQSSAFERNVSVQIPSDNSLNCLTVSPGLFSACEFFTAPQPREAQILKHLKDTEPFLKS